MNLKEFVKANHDRNVELSKDDPAMPNCLAFHKGFRGNGKPHSDITRIMRRAMERKYLNAIKKGKRK